MEATGAPCTGSKPDESPGSLEREEGQLPGPWPAFLRGAEGLREAISTPRVSRVWCVPPGSAPLLTWGPGLTDWTPRGQVAS